eukprot:2719416-Rhodomonas_salina.16
MAPPLPSKSKGDPKKAKGVWQTIVGFVQAVVREFEERRALGAVFVFLLDAVFTGIIVKKVPCTCFARSVTSCLPFISSSRHFWLMSNLQRPQIRRSIGSLTWRRWRGCWWQVMGGEYDYSKYVSFFPSLGWLP